MPDLLTGPEHVAVTGALARGRRAMPAAPTALVEGKFAVVLQALAKDEADAEELCAQGKRVRFKGEALRHRPRAPAIDGLIKESGSLDHLVAGAVRQNGPAT